MSQFDIAGSVAAGRNLMIPLADVVRHYQETSAAADSSDVLMDAALASRRITPEDYERYKKAPLASRPGIAFGHIQNEMNRWKEREAQSRIDAHKPSPWAQQPVWVTDEGGNSYQAGVFDEKGNPHYLPYGRAGAPGTSKGREAGPPPQNLPVPPGLLWDRFKLIPDPNLRKADSGTDDLAQLDSMARTAQLRKLDQDIAEAQGEIASGNKRPGPDWLPFTTPYADRAAQLRRQREALGLPGGGVPIESDPATGAKFYRDGRGNLKPLPDAFQGNRPAALGPTAGQQPESLAPATRRTPAALPNAPVAPNDVLNQARDAIRRGAPVDAVADRLRQMGVDPSGL